MRKYLLTTALLFGAVSACSSPQKSGNDDETIIVTGRRITTDTGDTKISALKVFPGASARPSELDGFVAYDPENPDHHNAVTDALSAYLAFLPDETRQTMCRMPDDDRVAVKYLISKKCRPSRTARRKAETEIGAILFDPDLTLVPSISLNTALDKAAFDRRVPGCRTLIELFKKTPAGWVHEKQISRQFIEIGLCDERW